ncbi:UNC-like C-terminal-domain-containing protein [Cladochytrium replicatum]|nr:UNC-like C-terminal-domain-containing protein [Cladochytrium replicatum]
MLRPPCRQRQPRSPLPKTNADWAAASPRYEELFSNPLNLSPASTSVKTAKAFQEAAAAAAAEYGSSRDTYTADMYGDAEPKRTSRASGRIAAGSRSRVADRSYGILDPAAPTPPPKRRTAKKSRAQYGEEEQSDSTAFPPSDVDDRSFSRKGGDRTFDGQDKENLPSSSLAGWSNFSPFNLLTPLRGSARTPGNQSFDGNTSGMDGSFQVVQREVIAVEAVDDFLSQDSYYYNEDGLSNYVNTEDGETRIVYEDEYVDAPPGAVERLWKRLVTLPVWQRFLMPVIAWILSAGAMVTEGIGMLLVLLIVKPIAWSISVFRTLFFSPTGLLLVLATAVLLMGTSTYKVDHNPQITPIPVTHTAMSPSGWKLVIPFESWPKWRPWRGGGLNVIVNQWVSFKRMVSSTFTWNSTTENKRPVKVSIETSEISAAALRAIESLALRMEELERTLEELRAAETESTAGHAKGSSGVDAALENVVKGLKDKVESERASVRKMEITLEENVEKLRALYKALSADADANDAKKLDEAVATFIGKVSKARDSVNVLEKRMEVLEERTLKLKGSDEDLEKRIGGLRSAVQDLVQDYVSQSVSESVDAKTVVDIVKEQTEALWEKFMEHYKNIETEQHEAMNRQEILKVIEAELANVAKRVRADAVKVTGGGSVAIEMIRNELRTSYNLFPVDRPDYARHSAGAKVLKAKGVKKDGGLFGLTSDTYTHMQQTWWQKLFAPAPALSRGPTSALSPEMNMGDCWAMKGSSGQLVINLSRPIVPTHIAINHLARHLAHTPPDDGLNSAPHELEFWGILQNESDGAVAMLSALEALFEMDWDGMGENGNGAVRMLGKWSFDVRDEARPQVFKVPETSVEKMKSEGKRVGVLVVRVKSNWGHEKWTCLYRVQVFGDE